jgi:molybdopterin molybdotransferase
MTKLLAVSEAIARILAAVAVPTRAETVDVTQAVGRRLCAPLVAARTQPPFRASAMDGYALRAADLAVGAPLTLIGTSAAGHGFHGALKQGETVRIFTGAPLPEGADTILIQENAQVAGTQITPTQSETPGRFVRAAGVDFTAGQSFFHGGYRLRPKDMALAASLGLSTIEVRNRPRVAVLATGDELVLPGTTPATDQIIAANHITVQAMAEAAGAQTLFLGIARDTLEDLAAHIKTARDWQADILVTMGGASEGDHDLVQAALKAAGMELDFWKIAMRPGKPLMFGGLGHMRVLGLPGNPASSIVCAHVFLKPLIAAFLGDTKAGEERASAGRLTTALPANDQRQEYMRASLQLDGDGKTLLTPLASQDSSLTHILAQAQALIIRAPFAEAANAGDACRYIALD